MKAAVRFRAGHGDYIHDLSHDWYGKRLASCSSDKTIRVYDHDDSYDGSSGSVVAEASSHGAGGGGGGGNVNNETLINNKGLMGPGWKCVASWRAHQASVWRIDWAHPQFGQVSVAVATERGVSTPSLPPSSYSLSLSLSLSIFIIYIYSHTNDTTLILVTSISGSGLLLI